MDVKITSGDQTAIRTHSPSLTNSKYVRQKKGESVGNHQVTQAEKTTYEVLKETIKNINKKLSMLNSQLKVEIDNDTGIRVVKVIDKETQKVIRQIPPEVAIKIAKYIDEVTGLLFNEKA